MSNTHTYEPLSERHIRLLKLPETARPIQEPDIIEVSLEAAPPYETISYVWGEQDKSCVFELGSGKSVLITPTLRTTLTRIRLHCQTGYLWVDQVCVDQTSIPDRNQQVSLMGEIYSRCQRVLIWLGQEVQDTESLSHYFENSSFVAPQLQASFSFSSTDSHVPPDQKDLIFPLPRQQSFVRSLLSLPWFSRAWVVQEAVLPPKATCFLASSTFPIDELWAVIRRFRSSEDRIASADYVGLRQLQGYLVLSEIMRLRDQRMDVTGESSGGEEKPSFYHSLSLFAPRCRTTNKHDIVYAFLGLQDESQISILPDYHIDWNEVPVMVTRSIVEATESLDLLGVLHRRDDDETRWLSNLPSWVPDWSRRLKAEAFVFPKYCMYFDAARGMRHRPEERDGISSSCLIVRGKIIREVTHTLPFTQIDREPATSRHQWPVHSYLDIARLENVLREIWPEGRTMPTREHILKTCLADGSFVFNRTTSDYNRDGLSAADIQVLLQTYDYLHALAAIQDTQPSKPTKSWKTKATQLRDHARIAWGRQLVVGRDWRLGLTHDAVNDGDVICIIHGSKVPLVLRRLANGYYRLMGQCYFEGAMRGEEVTWTEASAEEFVLV